MLYPLAAPLADTEQVEVDENILPQFVTAPAGIKGYWTAILAFSFGQDTSLVCVHRPVGGTEDDEVEFDVAEGDVFPAESGQEFEMTIHSDREYNFRLTGSPATIGHFFFAGEKGE